MSSPARQAPEGAAQCPLHSRVIPDALGEDDELVFPMHQRAIVQYGQTEAGAPELRIFWEDKEISFDEVRLFAFAETLSKQHRFRAGDALDWGDDYQWQEIGGLLEQLMAEGVLRRAGDLDAARQLHGDEGSRPSPLPPAPALRARAWPEECEEIMRDLTGHSLELGYLELVIPIFRVAHAALDADGRHVGEANVFPRALRTEVPTRWRTCIYSGSRFQSERPMNVSALKGMRAHWGQMMAALLRIREAYLCRFPEARNGWTVGDLERLATTVLAVPTYQLMRSTGNVANGQLHPALSSLFRVTDGLRMVMHQMLFVPIGEPTVSPDAPVSSAAIFAYAERNYSFHSDTGVCAGPRSMVEEFLGVLVDGRPPREPLLDPLPEEVEAALTDVETSMDYAMLGLRAYALIFSLWPVMTRAYETLTQLVQDWPAPLPPALGHLGDRLAGHMDTVKRKTYLANEAWRVDRERVYADMFMKCGRGLRAAPSVATLEEALASTASSDTSLFAAQLQRRIARVLELPQDRDVEGLASLTDCLTAYFRRQQAILRAGQHVQRDINDLLGRSQPRRAFLGAHIDIHNLLQGAESRQLPYLDDELQAWLGVRIIVTQDGLKIEDIAEDRELAVHPQ